MRTRAWLLGALAGCVSTDGPPTDDTDTDAAETDTDVDTDDTDVDTDDTDVDTDDTDVDTDDTDPALCADRTGGALITFEVVDETFTGWFTDTTFVDAALVHLANGTAQVPNFLDVVEGTDCDAQWSFHVDPAQVEFADFTIELCDGLPSYVDAHLADWVDEVGQWCPWSAEVVSVDDRR